MTSFSNLSPGDENFLVMSLPDLLNLIHRFLSPYKENYGNNSKNKKSAGLLTKWQCISYKNYSCITDMSIHVKIIL